jgi:hypothetical protein
MHSKSVTAKPSNRRKIAVISLAALVLVACGAWGVVHLAGKDKGPDVPAEFTVEALKTKAQDPGQMFEQMHQAMQRTDLTEEQRHAIHENLRAVMEVQMDKRLDEYFTAPPAQQKAVLDRHLNEMQTRMKEWQQRRAERGEPARPGEPRPGSGQAAGSPPPGPGAQAAGAQGGRPGGPDGRRGPPTREERKTHSESRDPDKMARRIAYFTAMRERAEERGIQLPFGPPGHRR